jgi:hypothetical protein
MNNNINFKELRLDNYICINNNLHPCRVKEITMSSVVVEAIKENYSEPTINSMNPIPLTEEWLIRMGFEKSYFENIPYFEKRCLTIDGCFFDVELMDGSKLELKSVHQLQNLYFALTNEELTMK